MLKDSTPLAPSWFKERLKRHLSELGRLALPVVLTRVGVLGLGMVDTAMVGHYATNHLAWLNLANQSVVMFALVVGIGLMMGILIMTASAFGEENYEECGQVWRRTLPFTLLVGLSVLIISWPAEFWLSLLGQSDEPAKEAGKLIQILAIGLPANLLFVNCSMFLEGIKRAEIGFYLMFAANIVNVGLNYILIYGFAGIPEMGATGSAWASTGVRLFLAAAAIAFIWYAPSIQKFGVRNPVKSKWREWKDQRHIGYASAVSLAAEVIAFSAIAVFAGWLGTIPLAAHGVMYQVLGLPIMIAVGIGIATSVRVGIAFSRKDAADTMLAGLSGFILNLVVVTGLAIVILLQPEALIKIFTSDSEIVTLLIPITFIFTVGMIFDGSQMVSAGMLRGLKETWWPTYLQTLSFVGVMLPASYILAFSLDRGFLGLMEGTFIGVFVSWVLLSVRFVWLMKSGRI
ncbi:MATE family efflux transporter [Kordiimonas sp. SCSIO 12610]|uniref:MATE family efflux transporter n=1 Tax=Kordiimonas sp. SCSIO 12610 TaxID=2829597 RepID=UPI002108C52D|nr:MATE family efflux transporter [Kordiimonas sp. SCSIO 12610]UTW55251.1 MATE family efflux transporter [Kordiimonas sp. SCSIO 12610]